MNIFNIHPIWYFDAFVLCLAVWQGYRVRKEFGGFYWGPPRFPGDG